MLLLIGCHPSAYEEPACELSGGGGQSPATLLAPAYQIFSPRRLTMT